MQGPVNGSAQYASANAFRRALDDRLKREAKARNRSLEELRREFLFQRFLALVFAGGDGQWVLKGGAGLLMRLPEARFSKDLDMLCLGGMGAEQAAAELREITKPGANDHLRFIVEDGVSYSRVNPVLKLKVTAYIGARYGTFPIDLANELHFIAAPEKVRPDPVVEMPGMTELPEVVVYPLADQVADKVCAMYESYGELQGTSTRYRDLLDLALIVSACQLDGRLVSLGIDSERRRRGVVLPAAMTLPGTHWTSGYAGIARRSRLPANLRSVDGALSRVGECLNPILAGRRAHGSWVPAHGWSG